MKKRARKLTPYQQVLADLKNQVSLLEDRNRRISESHDHQADAIRDKNAGIAARDDVIRQKEQRINELIAERNMIVRLVDQFTSVKITEMSDNNNSPKNLRRT